MADDPTPTDKPAFTLDLSTGKPPSKRKRKGPPPVVQQTINLSTPKPAAPEAEAPTASGRPHGPKGGSKGNGPKAGGAPRDRNRAPKAAGTSLADLLDPDTLARLRGE